MSLNLQRTKLCISAMFSFGAICFNAFTSSLPAWAAWRSRSMRQRKKLKQTICKVPKFQWYKCQHTTKKRIIIPQHKLHQRIFGFLTFWQIKKAQQEWALPHLVVEVDHVVLDGDVAVHVLHLPIVAVAAPAASVEKSSRQAIAIITITFIIIVAIIITIAVIFSTTKIILFLHIIIIIIIIKTCRWSWSCQWQGPRSITLRQGLPKIAGEGCCNITDC